MTPQLNNFFELAKCALDDCEDNKLLVLRYFAYSDLGETSKKDDFYEEIVGNTKK